MSIDFGYVYSRPISKIVLLLSATTLLLYFVGILPIYRIDVPLYYAGDELDKLVQIQNVAETGWLFHNDRLGYPFGYDRLYFPRFDSLNYVIMGPIAALTSSPGLAMNIYFIAGFYLVALTSFLVFRGLGLSDAVALLCSLIYAFLPYHFYRGTAHITNSFYFLVPLAMMVAVWTARNQLNFASPIKRGRWITAITVAILLPLQTPYNGVFFVVLCVISAIVVYLAKGQKLIAIVPAMLLVAATLSSFFIEQIPSIIYKRQSPEFEVAMREPIEAELYGLRLNQMLLPTTRHRIQNFALAKTDFDKAFKMQNESTNQYVGILGIIGLVTLLWSLVKSATNVDDYLKNDETYQALVVMGILTIAIILVANTGGVASLISYFVTNKVRAYNRIHPFLAFMCLFSSGWLLDQVLAKFNHSRIAYIYFVGLSALAILDITANYSIENRETIVDSYDNDRDFFRGVEKKLGLGSALFEFPSVWYPEHPTINRMPDYESFKPFIHTSTLRTSYGVAKGTAGYAFGKTVTNLPIRTAIEVLHSNGFRGLLVDTYAYTQDEAEILTKELSAVLQMPPLVSKNQRWWVFPLEGCCSGQALPTPTGVSLLAVPYTLDNEPLRFGVGGTGLMYDAGGWYEPEYWGVWSKAVGVLRMQINPFPSSDLQLEIKTRMFVPGNVSKRMLHIKVNGKPLTEVTYLPNSSSKLLSLHIKREQIKGSGVLEISFDVTPAISPNDHGIGKDIRTLGIGLESLVIKVAE